LSFIMKPISCDLFTNAMVATKIEPSIKSTSTVKRMDFLFKVLIVNLSDGFISVNFRVYSFLVGFV
jgi:hypothetical protein